MTQNDIDRIYTDIVAKHIADGYQINPATMGGSQGEMAHIDLRKGSEIHRVLIDLDYQTYTDGEYYGDTLIIRAGRVIEPIRCGGIWNNHLETLSEIKLAKITKDYYTEMEEAKHIRSIQMKRWKAKAESLKPSGLGDPFKSAQIALRWLRKQPGMKTCRLGDITSITRDTDFIGGVCYRIKAKGKTFTIHA